MQVAHVHPSARALFQPYSTKTPENELKSKTIAGPKCLRQGLSPSPHVCGALFFVVIVVVVWLLSILHHMALATIRQGVETRFYILHDTAGW